MLSLYRKVSLQGREYWYSSLSMDIGSAPARPDPTHRHLQRTEAQERIASYPGPSQKKGEGLVYTVCACTKCFSTPP